MLSTTLEGTVFFILLNENRKNMKKILITTAIALITFSNSNIIYSQEQDSAKQENIDMDNERLFLNEKALGNTIFVTETRTSYKEAIRKAQENSIINFAESFLFSREAKFKLSNNLTNLLNDYEEMVISYSFSRKFISENGKTVEMNILLNKEKIFNRMSELGLIETDFNFMRKILANKQIFVFPTNKLIPNKESKEVLQTLSENIKKAFTSPIQISKGSDLPSYFYVVDGAKYYNEKSLDTVLQANFVVNNKIDEKKVIKYANELMQKEKIGMLEDYDVFIIPIIESNKLGEVFTENGISFYRTRVKVNAYLSNKLFFSESKEIEIFFANRIDNKSFKENLSIGGAGQLLINSLIHKVYEKLESL